MKNPLNRRYPRELRDDLGKYIAIFLFLVFFVGAMSGFFVSDISVAATYNEGLTKYNIEDGHLAFNIKPGESLLTSLENDNSLKFYELFYKDETLSGTDAAVRIYKNRDELNLMCIMDGRIAESADEIAVDRMFAVNNSINIGDTVTLASKQFKVVGYTAVPDYSCLFESNADMMFDAVNFGVAFVTEDGYNSIRKVHESYNYAWKYASGAKNDTESKNKSDALTDSLETDIKAYDTQLIQVQVDAIYAEAKEKAEALSKDFETASKAITDKITKAGESAGEKAIASLSEDEIMEVVVSASGKTKDQLISSAFESLPVGVVEKIALGIYSATHSEEETLAEVLSVTGMSEEDLMNTIISAAGLSEEKLAEAMTEYYTKKTGVEFESLIARELGISYDMYKELTDAFKDAENLMSDFDSSEFEAPKINLDDLDNEDNISGETDFNFDEIYSLIDKVSSSGLYDMSSIRASLDSIKKLTESEIDDSGIVTIEDYNPAFTNKAINFTIDDTAGDKASASLMLYLIIAVIAFMFAVTSSNTITRESNVIGTLRASGYTKGELVRHYMTLPIVITLLGAVIGNILGYTVFEKMFVSVYYTSYSLPTYETHASMQAFLETTVVPLILVVVINFAVISRKMQLSPLNFLRGELKKGGKKKTFALPEKLPFMSRFRLRILFQNIPSYLTMFVGIFLGGVLAVFGFMFTPLLDDYGELVKNSQISTYQYVLLDTKETSNTQAEKYCVTSLDTTDDRFMTDEVMIYGIEPSSKYVKASISSGKVFVSNAYANKFSVKEGDKITLKEKYSDKKYEFEIGGIYTYDAAVAVFMPRSDYLKTFGEDDDYFTGYFSNEALSDLSDDDIAAVITEKDLTKIVTQMKVSMGEFMNVFKGLAAVIFLLVIYVLTKQIIERNSRCVSMTKILGFTDSEIARLYIIITSVVVCASFLISIPLINLALKAIFKTYLYTQMTGYIPYIISNSCFVKMFVMGMLSYAVVVAVMFRKIKKTPKGEALKNQNL